jgi:hypothetical protein
LSRAGGCKWHLQGIVKSLIRNCFVNSKSSDEAVRFYKEYYAEKEDQQALREEVVKNFYDLLRDMLQVAIMPHQGRKVPDEVVSDWNWLWREEKEPLLQNYIIILNKISKYIEINTEAHHQIISFFSL